MMALPLVRPVFLMMELIPSQPKRLITYLETKMSSYAPSQPCADISSVLVLKKKTFELMSLLFTVLNLSLTSLSNKGLDLARA